MPINPYFRPMQPLFGPIRPSANPYDVTFQPDETPQFSPEPQPVGMPQNYLSVLSELQNQTSPAASRYSEYLKQMPTRDNYKPNWLSKLAAGMVGVSEGWRGGAAAGVKASRDILDNPYNRAVDDWKMKGAVLATDAEQEQQSMARKISFVKTINDMQNKAEELRLRGDEVSARRMEAEARAKYYEFQTGKKLEPIMVNGKVYMRDQQGNLVNELGESEQSLTRRAEDARQNRGFAHTEKMAGIEFGNRSALQANQQKFEKGLEDKKEANRAVEQATTMANRDISPTEQAQSTSLALQQVAAEHPEWKDFVNVVTDKNKILRVEGKPPASGTTDPEYMKFWDAVKQRANNISGKRQKDLKPTTQPTETKPAANTTPKIADVPKELRTRGQVFVMPDGVSLGRWNGSFFEPAGRVGG